MSRLEYLTDRIVEIVNSELDVESTAEDSFVDLGADSLDIIQLVVDCEQEFKVHILDKYIGKIHTVQDLVNVVYNADSKDYFESTQADLQPNE